MSLHAAMASALESKLVTAILIPCLLSLAGLACQDNPPRADADLVPVEIVGMYPYEEGGVGVFLQGEKSDIVRIVIGEFEALALQMALAGQTTPRPIAYDLVASVLDNFDGAISGLVVHSIVDNVFHGNLEITAGSRSISIDCRPSDGMVLATRARAPIYVTYEVMEKAGTKTPTAKKVSWFPGRRRPTWKALLQEHESPGLRTISLN